MIPIDNNTVVSVVVPLENARAIVADFLHDLDRVMSAHYRFYEIVLVDDGSMDGTLGEVRGILETMGNVRYMRLSRSFGRDIAISAGIESAMGDFVVTLAPESDPVDQIPAMVRRCREIGGIVQGQAENPIQRSALREWAGNYFRAYCMKRFGVEIRRGADDFRAISRQAVNAMLQIHEQSRYLRVLTQTVGYDHEFFPYSRKARTKASDKQPVGSELGVAIDLLTSYTRHPLRVVTAAGLLGAMLNLVYALYVVTMFFVKSDIAEGWTTLSLQMSGMFFLVSLILAVMSEYVGTILGEVRSRPLYFVAQEVNSSVLLEDTVRTSLVEDSEA